MAKYQTFDGRHARVGRHVVVATTSSDGKGVTLRAGLIASIADDDMPQIVVFDVGTSNYPVAWYATGFRFVTTTIHKLMRVGTWTWEAPE